MHLLLQENVEKASTICPESEIEAIGGCDSTMEQLNARLTTLKRRHERESQRYLCNLLSSVS